MKHLDRLYKVTKVMERDKTGWSERHQAAVRAAKGPEIAILSLLRGWLLYADLHRDRYESKLGTDYVLGPAWGEIGTQLRTLLNGETGRLDCSTLDSIICDSLAAEGYEEG